MPEIRASALKRILAVRLDNIGDVVMLSPALRALKAFAPRAHLTLMASPAGSQVAPLLPWVDEVITLSAVWQNIADDGTIDAEKELALIAELKTRRFDAAFLFTSFSQSPYPPAFTCYMAGIPIRVGQSKEFGGVLLTHWVRPMVDSQYQVERNLHLLREVGIPAEDNRMELAVPDSDKRAAEEILIGLGIKPHEPVIVLAPGASAAARRYDEARFAETARMLVGQSDMPVLLIGSTRERDLKRFPTLESLAAQHPRVFNLIGETNLGEMAALIGRSVVTIANNSGSMHIAAALNRPAVILYSGTEHFEQWIPPHAALKILNRPVPCAPCHRFECPYALECLDIPPEEVATATLDLLNETRAHFVSMEANFGSENRT